MFKNFYCSDFYQVFLYGIHSSLGGQVPDASFGRRELPLHPFEKELRNNPDYQFNEEYIDINQPLLNVNEAGYTKSKLFQPTEANKKGSFVYLQTWFFASPSTKPQAELIIVHGIAAYGGYLTKLVPLYCRAQVRVHLIDLPGHGRSDGVHVDLSSMDQLVEALNASIKRVRQYQPDIPIFVLGYSLGGLVAIHQNIKYPDAISGLSLIAPCVKLKDRFLKAPLLINVGKLMAFFTPRLVLPTPTEKERKSSTSMPETSDLTSDVNNPLVYKRAPRIGTLIMILNSTLQLPNKLPALQVPFIVQQGERDQVLDPEGANLLYSSTDSVDKLTRSYPNLDHNMFVSSQVIQDSIDWIVSQIRRQAPYQLTQLDSCHFK